MKFIFKRISENNEKILQSKGLADKEGIDYLMEKMFLTGIEILIFVGFIAYIPSIFLAIIERQYAIIFIDTILIVSIVVLYFLHNVKLKIRLIILLVLIYLLGVVLILSMGFKGTGLIYLLAFSVIASTFLGIRTAIVTIIINLITVLIFTLIVGLKVQIFPLYETYELGRWLVVSVNFMIVNIVISLSIAFFLEGLKKSLERENDLKKKLKKKSERLIEAKVRAEESDQLKTAFLANVSHEFRTPMNAIIGFTEIMLYTDPDKPKRMRYLQNIQKSSEQLLQIIHNTIEYSKIELGKIDLTPARFDIYENLNVIFEQLKPICPQSIEFIMSDYLKNDSAYIVSDREKLTQIFSNLIINAFKFTEKGSVSFGLMESAHKNFYQFYIKDTGIGIRKEKQKDIFTRFHKEDDFKEGTGLGLAISATLLFHLGGRIWLESEPGIGTTFFFILPTELAHKKEIEE
jgi:signal transduction histidine kinase